MNGFKIRCIVHSGCMLGEGPVWDNHRQLLYWVDILENRIYRHNPSDDSTNFWLTPEHVGFVIVRKNGNLIAGLKSGLHKISLGGNGTVKALRIDQIDENLEYIRFNDGLSDSSGGIWACTMDMRNRESLGKYFYYDREFRKTIIDEGYVVANGPALSTDERFLYTVESVGGKNISKGIYVSEITRKKILTNKKLLIGWTNKNTYPDGLITDASGNLWIGEFGGNILRCYSPSGKINKELSLPAWNITKAVIGGEKMNILYVTSARTGVDKDKLSAYPATGGIIEISGAL